MVALLSRMRKEMNGAVADAMFCYGKPYGLNYGVSLPTIRMIAHEIEPNNDLAQYLFKQQVRELQLAAMHIAQGDQLTLEEIETWGDGIVNSEIAEEMNISRQGVRDLIKNAEEELAFYEEKLGLAKKFADAQSHAKRALELCEQNGVSDEVGDEIRRLLDSVG